MISASGSTAAVEIVALTDWSLDMSTDTVEVTSLQDTNKVYVQGLPDLKGTFAGFWNAGVTTLFAGRKSSDGVNMYIYPSTSVATRYFYGKAWLSLSITGSVGDAVKISGSFTAKDAWADQNISA